MNNAKTILELLYYCSGVALALLGAIGLRQLSLAKQNIRIITEVAKTAAKRDAFRLAAEQCSNYYDRIIPLLNELNAWIDKEGLDDTVTGWDIEIDAGIKIRPKSLQIKEKYLSTIKSRGVRELAAINALEGMALLFTSGVAAEGVAFSSMGVSFCHSVRRLLPTLLMVADEGYFKHILTLFILWHKRIERQNLKEDRNKTDARLRELQERGIEPIGM